TVATLVFNADGTVEVDDGCNAGRGRWLAVGAGLVITDLGLTKKACPGDLGAFEDAILATLRAPSIEVVISRDQLELRRAERTGIGLRAS
ncbi:MAG: META domain-containing protein, partial [Chloroflexota bacterium]